MSSITNDPGEVGTAEGKIQTEPLSLSGESLAAQKAPGTLTTGAATAQITGGWRDAPGHQVAEEQALATEELLGMPKKAREEAKTSGTSTTRRTRRTSEARRKS